MALVDEFPWAKVVKTKLKMHFLKSFDYSLTSKCIIVCIFAD